MVITEENRKEYIVRLLRSRMRILMKHGFFGLLLMHMEYSLDASVATAATDGTTITFGPAFLEQLSDLELDFIMMHEVLHVALRHCNRKGNRDRNLFNIACDIVVNSNILHANHGDLRSITLGQYGESIHLAPTKKEGYLYTAEEVYELLLRQNKAKKENNSIKKGSSSVEDCDGDDNWDDHTQWGEAKDKADDSLWSQRVLSAAESVSAWSGKGNLPPCARRQIQDMTAARLDWKTVLNDFIKQETVDYSLFPPDRRYTDSPFFLPAFNEKEDYAENILFMIDTSGSMSDKEVSMVYQEILGAVEQFGGRLTGLLGFFDDEASEPIPFSDVSDVKSNLPKGGGGTNFNAVFNYIRNNMDGIDLAAIIILTDGFADFPDEKESRGIPVLWVINNYKRTPAWGQVVRLIT